MIRSIERRTVFGATMMQHFGGAPLGKRTFWLGILFPVIIAAAALWSSDTYAMPPLLVALVLGLIMKPLAQSVTPGVEFASRRLIELGVALLGFKVTTSIILDVGWGALTLVLVAMATTMFFSLLLAPLFRLSRTDGLLVGAATAICGSSACLAVGGLLPRSEKTNMAISVTIVGTTLLSSAAMIVYPLGAATMGMSDYAAGIVLGGSIHNVPQAIGAGLSFSDEAGAMATLVKLTRVAMLLPVVALVLLALPLVSGGHGRRSERGLVYIVPWFLPIFAALLAINSAGAVPPTFVAALNSVSELCLIVGLAAIGLKTSFKGLVAGGWQTPALIAVSALLLLIFLSIGVHFV